MKLMSCLHCCKEVAVIHTRLRVQERCVCACQGASVCVTWCSNIIRQFNVPLHCCHTQSQQPWQVRHKGMWHRVHVCKYTTALHSSACTQRSGAYGGLLISKCGKYAPEWMRRLASWHRGLTHRECDACSQKIRMYVRAHTITWWQST